jgi:hypothetical protein
VMFHLFSCLATGAGFFGLRTGWKISIYTHLVLR